jgi:hypothetical protein
MMGNGWWGRYPELSQLVITNRRYMKKNRLFLCFLLLLPALQGMTQDSIPDIKPLDKGSFGIGLGLDHGGFGGNFLVYPQRNIGIFFGVGYALAGIGINGGVKVRILPGGSKATVCPYALLMYGYNAAIYISNAQQYNKFFYGLTAGMGLDIRSRNPASKGYWSVAILFPFRSPDVQNYINSLQANNGVSFTNTLLPIGISLGYKIILF